MLMRPIAPPLFLALLCLAAPAAAQEAPTAEAHASRPDLTGRWAQRQQMTAVADVTFIGEVTTTTTSLLLIDITERDGALTLRELVCAIDIRSTADSVRMNIPAAFLRAVSNRTRAVTLVADGTGWRYKQPTTTVVTGAQLTDTAREKLPTDKADKRVTDPDRDHKPGLTVQVRGLIDGDIYVVQRDTSALEGALSADHQRIQGLITWRAEQVVLDATSVFLSGSPPKSAPHKDKRRSNFAMARVPAGASCADIKANAATLFTE